MARARNAAAQTGLTVEKQAIPRTMRAAVIDHFGAVDALSVRTVDVPKPDADEILIRVEFAGVGVWDPFEREGGFARIYGVQPIESGPFQVHVAWVFPLEQAADAQRTLESHFLGKPGLRI